MADPLAPQTSQQTSGQGGFLGQSPSFWQNLMNFGSQMSVADNARTPQGFLEYGTGLAGPLGAGILGAEQSSATNQQAASALQAQQAQTQGQQLQNQINSFSLPYLRALGMRQAQAVIQGPPTDTSGQSDTQPPASPAVSPTGQAVKQIESGGDYTKVNQQGYAGAYQFGTAALSSAGMYQPAKGEDVTKNQWAGTVTVPGFAPMSPQQFLGNPQAQEAAWTRNEQYLTSQIPAIGADKYVGQTVGGVPITPATLVGMMHFAGPGTAGGGVKQFLQTGGAYNPKDSNGTLLSQYGLAVANGAQGQQGQQSSAVNPMAPYLPQDYASVKAADAKANLLTQQAEYYHSIHMDALAKPLEDQASSLRSYINSTLAPQTLRGEGGSIVIPSVGTIRGTMPTTLYGPGNAAAPGLEVGGYSFNGGPIVPGSVIPIGGAAGQGSGAAPGAGAAGGAAPPQTQPNPITTEFIKERMPEIIRQQGEDEDNAEAASASNQLLTQLLGEGKDIDVGTFSPALADAKTKLLSVVKILGLGDEKDYPNLASTVADAAAFQKDSSQLVGSYLRGISARPAVAEMNYFRTAMPSQSSSQGSLSLVTNQLLAAHDWAIAKAQFGADTLQKIAAGTMTDPAESQKTLALGPSVIFNKNIGPSAFWAYRLSQTPDGQAILTKAQSEMAKTPEGRSFATKMGQQLQWGYQHNLFGLPAGQGM